jgi:hypothetical protein
LDSACAIVGIRAQKSQVLLDRPAAIANHQPKNCAFGLMAVWDLVVGFARRFRTDSAGYKDTLESLARAHGMWKSGFIHFQFTNQVWAMETRDTSVMRKWSKRAMLVRIQSTQNDCTSRRCRLLRDNKILRSH